MAQEFNLLLNIKATLLHYLETPNKWLQMVKYAYTDGFLLTQSNHQGVLKSLWGQ